MNASRIVGLLVLITIIGITNGLKCEMCGQYNEGVGSITPCLNYTPEHPEAYLKECTKPNEKFCVVSFSKKRFN